MVAMVVFAILFFGIMTDAGLLDPVVDGVLRAVGTNPARIVMGSALLAAAVHLEGSGAVTFLVAIPPLLPLYERLRMDKRILACVVAMAAGVMNITPWGGPLLRAAASLRVPVAELFNPLLPVMAVGLSFVFAVAWWLGRREAQRLASVTIADDDPVQAFGRILTEEERVLRRPSRLWLNVVLTVLVLVAMIAEWVPPALAFMVGTVVALVVNYPDTAMQRSRVDAHATSALMIATILMGAGAFLGVMKGSGMLDAMAHAAVARGAAGRRAAHAGPARAVGDAAQPAVRSRFLLLRRVARGRRSRRDVRGAGGARRTGSAPWADDDGVSCQSTHARDVPSRRLDWSRPGRTPTLLDSLPADDVVGDDGRLRCAGSIPPVSRRTLRLGAGAGYSGDRIEPAVELATHGQIDYLVFECLAERTIALAQQARSKDARAGFDPLLLDRMRAVLPVCRANGVRVITNMGAANPAGAADAVRALAREMGFKGLRVAAATGDDVLDQVRRIQSGVLDTGEPVKVLADRLVSANAYVGVEPVVDALAQGADVVITGRVADPSLFLAPQVYEFGWALR